MDPYDSLRHTSAIDTSDRGAVTSNGVAVDTANDDGASRPGVDCDGIVVDTVEHASSCDAGTADGVVTDSGGKGAGRSHGTEDVGAGRSGGTRAASSGSGSVQWEPDPLGHPWHRSMQLRATHRRSWEDSGPNPTSSAPSPFPGPRGREGNRAPLSRAAQTQNHMRNHSRMISHMISSPCPKRRAQEALAEDVLDPMVLLCEKCFILHLHSGGNEECQECAEARGHTGPALR